MGSESKSANRSGGRRGWVLEVTDNECMISSNWSMFFHISWSPVSSIILWAVSCPCWLMTCCCRRSSWVLTVQIVLPGVSEFYTQIRGGLDSLSYDRHGQDVTVNSSQLETSSHQVFEDANGINSANSAKSANSAPTRVQKIPKGCFMTWRIRTSVPWLPIVPYCTLKYLGIGMPFK